MIISGDLKQIDIPYKEEETGLYHSMNKLSDVVGIKTFTFSNDSIVRNGLIKQILDRY